MSELLSVVHDGFDDSPKCCCAIIIVLPPIEKTISMEGPEPQVTHLVALLSALIGNRLELTAAGVESTDTVVCSIPSTTLALRTHDGSPLSETHRAFLREMLALMHHESARSILEERIRVLERENGELSVRHREGGEEALDPLTGLYTRAVMLDKLNGEMNRAWRHGSPVSLLMIDVDHFKKVNDDLGEEGGNEVLKAIGDILRASCRTYDVAGRYGGEEFCVMLPNTPLNKTRAVAERIRRAIEAKIISWNGRSVSVTSSIGIAGLESIPEEVVFSTSSLIERADRALFIAKDKGRNRTETWSPSLTAYRPVGLDH